MKFWFVVLLLSIGTAFAQSGDKPGEEQAPPPSSMIIPPAPPLSVEEALKTFQLPPGFVMEAVASEPMIEAPVEIEFDPDGRMFVLEMRGFMPNVDGKGEDQPLGRIALLEDTDADGRMDRRTVFAENLVMPRAICVTRDGLLVAEPPKLWFFKDTNGDGKADEKTEISSDYGDQKNPEHTANGLLWGRDNWIYSANHTVRYRNLSGTWEKEPTNFRGQWGISQDDYGRLFFNSNSDQFRGDLVPSDYFRRNPNFKTPFGGNVQIARDQSTFPIRVNPGVNRGYQRSTLRPDGTLARFTAACGPVIYRGGLFPAEYYGAGFVCEPSANLVRCNFIRENNGILTATNAFPGREFLASTDERFRPVNLSNGPDGALYVVDMYRGVIQHRIYVTTFLRNQILDRGLETPLNQGRIYRIVPAGAKRAAPLPLSRLPAGELVRHLSATNGWTRDAAQQLLVERRDTETLPHLKKVASAGQFPAAIHALWVLDALNGMSPEVAPLEAAAPKVRATAVRVLEPWLRLPEDNEVKRKLLTLTNDPAFEVRLQLMFSLGEFNAPEAEQAMAALLQKDVENSLMRDAAVSGLHERELRFLDQLLRDPAWSSRSAGREEVMRDLAQSVASARDPERLSELLALAAAQGQRWQQYALLDGLATLIPAKGNAKEAPKARPVRFAVEPPALADLKKQADRGLASRLEKLASVLVWPGKEGLVENTVQPLTATEQRLFDAGKNQYMIICGACHQPNGLGLEGLAPPLVDSDWTTGSPERLTRIVLHGVRGPINVKGKVWELEMPALNILPDEDLAGLMTYIRREWGHTASAISPSFVARIRKETEDRIEAWTEPELLKIK